LYIRAWKSFAINQYLYIQNRKPFVINKSMVYTMEGCTRRLIARNREANPHRTKPTKPPTTRSQVPRDIIPAIAEKIFMSCFLRSGETGLPVNVLPYRSVQPAAGGK
jgi:hypothetical protein